MIRPDRRVLVFSAHAADFCSRAGGTIARLVDAGSQVQVWCMSYGERCESPAIWSACDNPDLGDIAATRRSEIQAAAAVLGCAADCFDFGDCPLAVGEERQFQVLDAVRAFRPDLVLSHWRDDFVHPDHAEATRAAIWASRYCNKPGRATPHPPCERPEMLCYECVLGSAPTVGFVPQLYVDISAVFERKMEALRCLASQPRLPRNYEIVARYRALEASTTAGLTGEFAEGFTRLGTQGVS